jgi:hypothetical protein
MNPMEMPHTGLIVLDVDRRTYIGLSHDGRYWHLIGPVPSAEVARYFDRTDADGNAMSPVAVGDLVCTCAGGRWKNTCYRLDQAKEFERSIEEEARWGDAPEPEKALVSA